MKNYILFVLVFLCATLKSQVSFKHIGAPSNTNAHITTLDHPALNGQPNALILVTQNYGISGPYNTHEVGVWYNGSRWTVYNESRQAMPNNAKFNISIQTGKATIHRASSIWGQTNSATETSYGNADDLIFITHNYQPSNVYNTHPTGIFYPPNRTKWSILTGNTAAMPINSGFNILTTNQLELSVFRHTTIVSNISAHTTIIDHPRLNDNSKAIIFILPNWNTGGGANPTGVNYQQNAGVWYNGSRWTIFSENTAIPMPSGLTFNVLIAPDNDPNYFTFTVKKENIISPPNGAVIDNAATNNKANALLLVTQNRSSVYYGKRM